MPYDTVRLNQHTTLIDVGMRGLAGATAVYLIQGTERSCLIDGGTRAEAHRIVRLLTELDAFPPDILIATHAHHDHAQGIPVLRRQAQERDRTIEVFASSRCIPLLADPTYNEVFDYGPYESIENVSPLDDGDRLDLGGISLAVIEVPGHSKDHIALLDKTCGSLFVGDALGMNFGGVYLPPFVPPSWDLASFRTSVRTISQAGYDSLCLTHFGPMQGQEALVFPDRALARTEAWWRLFHENEADLDDADRLFEIVMQRLEPGIPDLKTVAPALKGQTGSLAGEGGPGSGHAHSPGELFMRGFVAKLAMGCRICLEAQAG